MSIALIADEKLSPARVTKLREIVAALRKFSTVEILKSETTESELARLQEIKAFTLMLVPWHRYFSLPKLEAHFGAARSLGPTLAGYFCESIPPGAKLEPHRRPVLLDFAHLEVSEISTLVKVLHDERQRSGIRPWLDSTAAIYCENWYGSQGLGGRIDQILKLSEISKTEWAKRASAIRLTLCALWSLVYELGPGKSESNGGTSQPKAYFQLGADAQHLLLRLCYSLPGVSGPETLESFWPKAERSRSDAREILSRSADFLRVHTLGDSADLEITVGFLLSEPAERHPEHLHTIWLDPISPGLISEQAFEAPSPANPRLQVLPPIGAQDAARPRELDPRRDKLLQDAATRIRELQAQLAERDAQIRELRSGGVGSAQPLPPPDAEGLLEAFQEKFFDARFQIRQFELQIVELEKSGGPAPEREALRQKMSALIAREQTWIRKIAETIEAYKKAKAAK